MLLDPLLLAFRAVDPPVEDLLRDVFAAPPRPPPSIALFTRVTAASAAARTAGFACFLISFAAAFTMGAAARLTSRAIPEATPPSLLITPLPDFFLRLPDFFVEALVDLPDVLFDFFDADFFVATIHLQVVKHCFLPSRA
ncbi:MAG: hypothetical protein ACR2IE_15020 [Candidatus Sumerlaeaceae bacterium]